jgi:hypothetical protein
MSNMWGRSGAPMIQPTKDEIRGWLSETRSELKAERARRRVAEYRLSVATRKLGELVLEGKIAIPPEKLGEIVLQMAIDEVVEVEAEDA